MMGHPSTEVINKCGTDGVEFLQNDISYRLPWALEAVRVHALMIGNENANLLQGTGAMAVEVGSTNMSVITLLRSGLNSREAAITAVESTEAIFDNKHGMRSWINSSAMQGRTNDPNWPSTQSRSAWVRFYEIQQNKKGHQWKRGNQNINVSWLSNPPEAGTHVIIEKEKDSERYFVLSPEYSTVVFF